MLTETEQANHYIYSKGEMGDLIRSFDWTSSPIGSPSSWPVALLTTVNLILDSITPMFIWWGDYKVQFYNDAYKHLLGHEENCKHPRALGQKGEDCWHEDWPVIQPLIQRVMQNGGSCCLNDQIVPVYREGKLTKIYCTFTYSLIRDQGGKPGGILVVAAETTNKVKLELEILEGSHKERILSNEIATVNNELATSNEELLASNEELYRWQEAMQDLNLDLERRVASRTQEVLNAQLAQEVQRKRLATVISQVPAGLAILSGRELVLEMANEYMLNLWGRSSAAIGTPLLEFMPELKEQAFPGLLNDVYDTGMPFLMRDAPVEMMVGGQMERIYMDFSYTPLKDSSGITGSILILAENVTERTLSYQRELELREELSSTNDELAASNEELMTTVEELAEAQRNLQTYLRQLAESEARIRLMVADAPVAIGLLTGRGLIVESANDKMLEFWGKSDAIIGLPLHQALPEIDGQPFLEILDSVFTTRTAYYGNEVKAQLVRGGLLEDVYFNFVYHPLTDESGITQSIMLIATEVTEQVAARRLVEESEQRVRSMLNEIPQQVWTARADGALDYVNQVVVDDFGKSFEEIIGSGWQAFIHPDDLTGCLHKWVQALEKGHEYVVEFRILFHDGKYRWHLGRAVPLKEEGRVKLWLGTNTNIDQHKSNEQKKDEFLSIASHELKTPLTTIKAFNQLMRRTKNPELSGFVEKSAENISRLERLINDLLDVTKINAGKMNYNFEPFSFSQMLKDSVESVQHNVSSHGILLESLVDITFTGDQYRLEQVMTNFLNNAIKYSPNADKVIVNSKIEKNKIVVSVRDFGIGIAEENLDRLFDRYYRVDNTAMRFEGLGLGLFISSEILKRHKGNFWIESKQGEGSTFYFMLPFDQGEGERGPSVTRTDTYYRDSYITITYNDSHKRLDADWTGFQTLESVQHCCQMILEMMINNKCQKVVNDNRGILGTWSDAAQWVGEEWFPMMEKAGLRFFAWIFASSAFSQLSARKSIDVMNSDVVTQVFADMDEAEGWINEQPAD